MSLFQRSFVAPDATASFHPLFRLLDDFDQYSRNDSRPDYKNLKAPTFTPKFDVKEVADAYELHGELPGINQSDVDIEFTDNQALTIKGHTERSFARGYPPTGFVEDPSSAGSITESGENGAHKAHQPTVEDENKDTSVANTKKDKEGSKKDEKPKEPEAKYWVSERSIGEFSRSFTFPTRVDQDAVKASMKNGILSVIVPKAKKMESRKIAIN